MLMAEIGYGIAPEARGNGYATAAVGLVTRRVFAESPLRKLLAYVHMLIFYRLLFIDGCPLYFIEMAAFFPLSGRSVNHTRFCKFHSAAPHDGKRGYIFW